LTTWNFFNATKSGYLSMVSSESSLDAVEIAGSFCEYNPNECDFSVGFGGSPSEISTTTIDAMIMNGNTMQIGAVANLKNIKNGIGVARKVMENTYHTLIVGDDATKFALEYGFEYTQNMSTARSMQEWEAWVSRGCTPSYRKGNYSCPPNYPNQTRAEINLPPLESFPDFVNNHDTIGIVAIDNSGLVSCGTSTNGLTFRIPGRVGDSPIPGSGSYCDSQVGGAACTGNGDVIMRFLPSFKAVQNMKNGMSPQAACQDALAPIQQYFPGTPAAIICLNKYGEIGAANVNFKPFSYSYQYSGLANPVIEVLN